MRKMLECSQTKRHRAVLVGAGIAGEEGLAVDMEELRGLCEACDIEPVMELTQNLPREDSAYYIGSGKVAELRQALLLCEGDLVVVNNTLSPSQLANLAHDLEVEVIDRTNLILNIFAERARSKEARMQVDYAKLKYMLPRLVGLRQNLSRQGGTGGSMSNRGSGETQIELDRRHIEKQMAELRRGLREIARNRETQRKKRRQSDLPLVALVGYTNAGKSTLMNRLLRCFSAEEEKQVLAENMLFATLDTTVRRISPKGQRDFLLSDTVGFINRLPHDLVDAFRSTLEEALYSDLLLQVIDYSDPNYRMHMEVTERTLRELGAGHIPRLYVMNKSDVKFSEAELPLLRGDRIYVSSKHGIGIEELLQEIERKLSEGWFTAELRIPYDRGSAENLLREKGRVRSTKYEEDGIHIVVELNQELLQRCKEFLIGIVQGA